MHEYFNELFFVLKHIDIFSKADISNIIDNSLNILPRLNKYLNVFKIFPYKSEFTSMSVSCNLREKVTSRQSWDSNPQLTRKSRSVVHMTFPLSHACFVLLW